MAPILASLKVLAGHTALTIKSLPSFGYELSFGTSLVKVSRDGFKVFYVCKKCAIYYYFFIVVILVIFFFLLATKANNTKC